MVQLPVKQEPRGETLLPLALQLFPMVQLPLAEVERAHLVLLSVPEPLVVEPGVLGVVLVQQLL
jgi:hypothetical protein